MSNKKVAAHLEWTAVCTENIYCLVAGIGNLFPARAMPMVSPFLGTAFRSGFPGSLPAPSREYAMACPFSEQ